MKKTITFLSLFLTCIFVFSQYKRKRFPEQKKVRIDTVDNKIYHIIDTFGDIKGTKKDTIKIYNYEYR